MSQSVVTRRPIRKLPPLLVNQIAAGEVVERPASVVKELVENALDAGARRIVVELEQGGVELVRVTDDGCGIPEDELGLAIAPHATSKVSTPEDLDRIGTMGFRGEAIASIASVSRLSIRSRTREQPGGALIEVEGDRVSPVAPAAGPVGTVVSVRNLFFNTPARRKFLRTPQTEQGHCVEAVTALAIAHPGVGFSVTCDGRAALDVPPGQEPRDRALAVLGAELAEQLLEAGADRFDDARGLALWGLVGLPSVARATSKGLYAFLNGRPIRDKTVQHAVREAYRGLIEPGRWPTAVVMLEMDPSSVDVNVHPAKTEVRFRDQSMVHTAVLRAVKDALRRADLTPSVEQSTPWRSHETPVFGAGASGGGQPAPAGSGPAGSTAASFADFFRRPGAGVEGRFEYRAIREALQRVVPEAGTPTVEASGPVAPSSMRADGPDDTRAAIDAPADASAPSQPQPEPPPEPAGLPLPEPRQRLLQVHNSYLVTQDDQGLLIVDQHALHERVMFEGLLARITGKTSDGQETGTPGRCLESQALLTPVPVRVSPALAGRLTDLRGLLEKIGIVAELLGPETVGVQGFPTFLLDRGVEVGEFVAELLERAEAEGFADGLGAGGGGARGSESALHEVLDMMACKAAVKAGDRLTDRELGDLMKLREVVERSSNCPHGRPTTIRLTIKELEKRFGR
jgi:DNA mismatch repair protein MutL